MSFFFSSSFRPFSGFCYYYHDFNIHTLFLLCTWCHLKVKVNLINSNAIFQWNFFRITIAPFTLIILAHNYECFFFLFFNSLYGIFLYRMCSFCKNWQFRRLCGCFFFPLIYMNRLCLKIRSIIFILVENYQSQQMVF